MSRSIQEFRRRCRAAHADTVGHVVTRLGHRRKEGGSGDRRVRFGKSGRCPRRRRPGNDPPSRKPLDSFAGPTSDRSGSSVRARSDRLPHGRINPRSSIPFFLVHLLPLLAIFTGVPATAWCCSPSPTGSGCSSSPPATTATSRTVPSDEPGLPVRAGGRWRHGGPEGPLWWAGHHRIHHRYADTIDDPHTPARGSGGAMPAGSSRTTRLPPPEGSMKEFEKFPELRFLTRHDWIAPWTLGARLLPDRGPTGPAHRVLPARPCCCGTRRS